MCSCVEIRARKNRAIGIERHVLCGDRKGVRISGINNFNIYLLTGLRSGRIRMSVI